MSAGLLIGRGKKSQNFAGFLGTKSQKNWPISREFCGNFRGKLGRKAIGKKRRILWLFLGQISLEIYRFCSDQSGVFTVFQQQYTPEMKQLQSL